MLKELVEKKRYSFHEGFDDWRDAVRAACQPLIDDGSIKTVYPDEIIKKVEELGPYIVIAPNLCIPHAQEGVGVNETAMCFMKTEKPAHFDPNDPEKDARVFVVLASTDNNIHLQNLALLVETMSDEEKFSKILEAKTAEDLVKIEE